MFKCSFLLLLFILERFFINLLFNTDRKTPFNLFPFNTLINCNMIIKNINFNSVKKFFKNKSNSNLCNKYLRHFDGGGNLKHFINIVKVNQHLF